MSPCGSCNCEGVGVRWRRGSCNCEGVGVRWRRGSCNSETHRSVEAVRYVSEARGSGSEAPWKRVGSASDVRNMRFFDFHGGFVGDVGRMASHLRGRSTSISSSCARSCPPRACRVSARRHPNASGPAASDRRARAARASAYRGLGQPLGSRTRSPDPSWSQRSSRAHEGARRANATQYRPLPPRRCPEPPCVRRPVVGVASPGAPLRQPGSPRRDERVSGASPLLSRSLAESAWSALTRPLVKLTRTLVKVTKRPWSRTRPGSLGAGAASLDDLR